MRSRHLNRMFVGATSIVGDDHHVCSADGSKNLPEFAAGESRLNQVARFSQRQYAAEVISAKMSNLAAFAGKALAELGGIGNGVQVFGIDLRPADRERRKGQKISFAPRRLEHSSTSKAGFRIKADAGKN